MGKKKNPAVVRGATVKQAPCLMVLSTTKWHSLWESELERLITLLGLPKIIPMRKNKKNKQTNKPKDTTQHLLAHFCVLL